MRILFLTQYYPPETGAPQNRISDWAVRLAARGHEITVLTAMPNYPAGKIFQEYRGRLLCEERRDGIRVVRTWIYATQSKDFIARIVNYFSFAASSVLLGIFKTGRQDVIVVESPPLFTGISALVLKVLLRAKLVFNVSDLWPESAVALGMLNNRLLIALSTWLENLLYRKSALITGQTNGIVSKIAMRFPQRRVELITNGVDIEFFESSSVERARDARRKLDLNDGFIVGYAGLHGLAQGLETVLDAANRLKQYPDIRFAFFGDGPEKPRLETLARDMALDNVRFYPNQSRNMVPEVLASFDVAVVPLRRLTLFHGALPSKMFEAMAAAVPIILLLDGEARTVIEQAQAGVCVEPEDSAGLAKAILTLYRNEPLRRKLGINGRAFVTQHYDRAKIARRFEQLLVGVQSY